MSSPALINAKDLMDSLSGEVSEIRSSTAYKDAIVRLNEDLQTIVEGVGLSMTIDNVFEYFNLNDDASNDRYLHLFLLTLSTDLSYAGYAVSIPEVDSDNVGMLIEFGNTTYNSFFRS